MSDDKLQPPENLSFFQELLLFMKQEKKWWLAPILFILLGMGLFIVMTESSAVMPFIYALF
jgi:hypothetical protein